MTVSHLFSICQKRLGNFIFCRGMPSRRMPLAPLFSCRYRKCSTCISDMSRKKDVAHFFVCHISNNVISFQHSGHGSVAADMGKGEVKVTVWTRSTTGAVFCICNHEHKHSPAIVEDVEVKPRGTGDVTESPTLVTLTKIHIIGPTKIKIKTDKRASRFLTLDFMVVFNVYLWDSTRIILNTLF